MSIPAGIDPRGPRFAAAITAVLLLLATFLALIGISTARGGTGWFAYQPLADATFTPSGWAIASASLAQRALDPGFFLALVIALLFLWGLVSPRTAPWGALFRSVVRPRLPRFSQGVGLLVVGIGLVLHLLGVAWALPIATAAAFLAAFLNAAFAFCLGCQLYLLLQRAGLIGREAPAS